MKLSESDANPGTGQQRRYTAQDAVQVSIIAAMLRLGIPIGDASRFTNGQLPTIAAKISAYPSLPSASEEFAVLSPTLIGKYPVIMSRGYHTGVVPANCTVRQLMGQSRDLYHGAALAAIIVDVDGIVNRTLDNLVRIVEGIEGKRVHSGAWKPSLEEDDAV
jgi:hypothetical protein